MDLKNQNNLIRRIVQKDATLWSKDPAEIKKIQNRLGWIDSIQTFDPKLVGIRAFVDTIDYNNIVLLGMGGSSLVSRVFDQATPNKVRNVFILDTTDPATILDVQNKINIQDTLFIVASKSGTTIEVDSLFAYFFHLCPNPQQFIAITDFNTPLMHLARKLQFRHIFINPSDIGGRFSALSYFGLIPLALMGGDLLSFFEYARNAVDTCIRISDNPALELAEKIFSNHQAGRNKMFFDISSDYQALSLWIEQLVAESIGKQGIGIIPILQGKPSDDSMVVNIGVSCIEDLAKEFYQWEMATALLGAMLEINPFDEPNVVSSKKNTTTYLESSDACEQIRHKIHQISQPIFNTPLFLKEIQPPELIFVLSYLSNTHPIQNLIQHSSVSVSVCTGPSYLHSTGQLHKGGPNQGRFIIVVDAQEDLKIPGKPYGFQTLKLAQALGDYEALKKSDRKVILVTI